MVSLSAPGAGTECPTPQQLVYDIVQTSQSLNELSTFSPSVYDTAWLAMVHKRQATQGHSPLLFPGCLEFLLAEQQKDGTWPYYGSRFDAIPNSLAALLALVTCRETCDPEAYGKQLQPRIEIAIPSVRRLLQAWNVEATVQVGFEVLIMSLLDQLRAFGICFEFDGQKKLELMYKRKMQKFTPEMIYSNRQTTLLHSLEALVGVIEFDRVKHHCSERTGIMASPAATAAYLMNSTDWDFKAELYLTKVVQVYSARGSNSVPSAFPTSIFEISWVISSVISNLPALGSLNPEAQSKITSFLRDSIKLNNGTAGFAPGVMSDADDTARSMMALQLLQEPVDYDPMIKRYEAETHFRTYEMERNPSFSANCNVLLALLYSDNVDRYATQISKALIFLLLEFEEDRANDKWNLSSHYCHMLMAQATVKVSQLFNAGHLQSLNEELIQERISLALCRMILHALGTQKPDGSWGQSLEETSYAVLTISWALRLAWAQGTNDRLNESLEQGIQYIRSHYTLEPSTFYFWVEKTTYESTLLKIAYCSMALHTESTRDTCSTSNDVKIANTKSAQTIHLLSNLSNFKHLHNIPMELILAEASHLVRFLQRVRQDIVPRDLVPLSKDKYLEFIPMIWTMCNYKAGNVLPVKLIQDMVWLSLLNYQIDEFMETVVGRLGEDQLKMLVGALQEDIDHTHNGNGPHLSHEQPSESEQPTKVRKLANGNSQKTSMATHDSVDTSNIDSIESILTVLRRYITHVQKHPSVLASPPNIRHALTKEIHTFLIAHIAHNTDNQNLQTATVHSRNGASTTQSSYFKWVHTTGANDTSCPVSFQYFACLLSYHRSQDTAASDKKITNGYLFHDAHAEYLAQSFVRSLAVMCRMYNDYGSTARDKVDGTLNSVDFAEFSRERDGVVGEDGHAGSEGVNGVGESPEEGNGQSGDGRADGGMGRRKAELMRIAEFERKKMEFALGALGDVVGDEIAMSMLRVFVDVTDTFGLVYVYKDIASTRLGK